MSFETIPPSIFMTHVIPFIESSKDLLSLRVTSKSMKSLLHESDISEDIWKHFLTTEFDFSIHDSSTENTSTTSSNVTHYLQCLKVSPQFPPTFENDSDDNSNDNDNNDDSDNEGERAVSIFGYQASNGVYTANSAYESWRQWHIAKRRYCHGCPIDKIDNVRMNAPYFLRAANLWTKIETWCNQESNQCLSIDLLDSLSNGKTFQNGRFHGYENDWKNGTDAFRAIFAFYDGQKHTNLNSLMCGMFGGYMAYDVISCLRLCTTEFSMKSIGRYKCIAMNGFNEVIRARTCYYYLDCSDGNIIMSDYSPDREHRIESAVTMGITTSSVTNDTFDAGLVWMEELARKLENEEMEIGELSMGDMEMRHKMLFVYPTEKCTKVDSNDPSLPLVSRTITRGIEIVASSHYDPCLPNYVSYSIRMRLLPVNEEGYMSPSERGFDTCQLMTRHWVLRNGNTNQDEVVDGDGVIGLYPLLMDNGFRGDHGQSVNQVTTGRLVSSSRERWFRYQSLSSTDCTSFRGRIRFVPGSLREPAGEPFYADVGIFALVGP